MNVPAQNVSFMRGNKLLYLVKNTLIVKKEIIEQLKTQSKVKTQ